MHAANRATGGRYLLPRSLHKKPACLTGQITDIDELINSNQPNLTVQDADALANDIFVFDPDLSSKQSRASSPDSGVKSVSLLEEAQPWTQVAAVKSTECAGSTQATGPSKIEP